MIDAMCDKSYKHAKSDMQSQYYMVLALKAETAVAVV